MRRAGSNEDVGLLNKLSDDISSAGNLSGDHESGLHKSYSERPHVSKPLIPASEKSGSLYKGTHHMSTSAFQTLAEEIVKHKAISAKITKSQSWGEHERKVEGPLLLQEVANQTRRTLYGTLPMVAAFGMQHRESQIKRVLSTVSSSSLENLRGKDSEHQVLLSEIDVDEIIMTFPLLMAVLIATISQFLVGYNTGVMNPPESVVFPGHTTTEWALAVSAFAIGGPGGAVLGGFLANTKGRRGAILINSWIFLIGGLIMALAPNVYWLIPGRLITGFASGLSTVVIPVYLGEIAPPTLRGTLGTCTQFSMVIGILFSDFFGFPFATPDPGWRFLFGITCVFALLQLAVSPFLLESPRWLLSNDENSPEARVAIKQLRGFRLDTEVEFEVQHFLFASMKHKTDRTSAHSGGAMLDLLYAKEIRILVLSTLVLQMGQQLCGINAVFYYSTDFFQGIIADPLLGSTLVAFINVVAVYVALILMDTTARRTLILWSAGGMLISTVFIIVALLGLLPNYIALVAVMAYVSFFEIGLGPIPWLIVAEMFDSKYVATAMSMACIVNWACNFLVGLLFPYMQEALGPWSFGPFAVVIVAIFVFTYLYLPETHGRSVDDIQRLVGSGDDEVQQAFEMIQAVECYDFEDERDGVYGSMN